MQHLDLNESPSTFLLTLPGRSGQYRLDGYALVGYLAAQGIDGGGTDKASTAAIVDGVRACMVPSDGAQPGPQVPVAELNDGELFSVGAQVMDKMDALGKEPEPQRIAQPSMDGDQRLRPSVVE